MDRVRKEISEKKGASTGVQHAKKTVMKSENDGLTDEQPVEVVDKTRINMLWACFSIMATYISLQLLAAILTGTTSVMADSAQGTIDVATYGVSIYSQYKIDKSGDSLYQRKTGIWSAYFGAGSLFAMSFFFLAYTVYTILNDAEESPEKWLMVGASVLNASIDFVCIMLMDKANSMKEIIPWLFGKSESKSSEVHVLADLGRSLVIFSAGVAIVVGANDGIMDQAASVIVNVIGLLLAVKVIVLTRSLAKALDEEERLKAQEERSSLDDFSSDSGLRTTM